VWCKLHVAFNYFNCQYKPSRLRGIKSKRAEETDLNEHLMVAEYVMRLMTLNKLPAVLLPFLTCDVQITHSWMFP
jgi:hypothetical protein